MHIWPCVRIIFRRYKSMKNRAKKAVSKAMSEKAEEVLTE